jgi:acyl-CoA thioesterase-1
MRRFDWKFAIPVVVLAGGLWLLWPSSYSRVKNLDSRGASIIAFGDSLTAGYGAQPNEAYPSRLSALIDAPVLNAGVSGDTTQSALDRVSADVLTRDPRIVIVGLGGNDFLGNVPIATTEANLHTIVQQIENAGAMVVLIGFRFPSLNADYEGMYRRVAKEEKCLLVTGVLKGVLTNPTLKSDEIHPNARGYQMMAERIAGPVKKLVAAANRRR